MAKPFLYPIVVEYGECDGRFSDSAGSDESDGSEGVCEINDLVDQLSPTETGPWPRGR